MRVAPKQILATALSVSALLAGAGLPANSAVAEEAGDWLVRVGGHYVDPKSDNSDIVEVDGAASITFEVGYMMTKNWGVELLAAVPFTHDINLKGGGKVAETKHLPPTLYVTYHFNQDSAFQPYLGAGVNYTIFFDEDTKGALAGTKLELDPSVGVSAVAGIDYNFNDKWFANVSVRYMNIESDAKVTGPEMDPLKFKVEIDPISWGLNVGYRF